MSITPALAELLQNPEVQNMIKKIDINKIIGGDEMSDNGMGLGGLGAGLVGGILSRSLLCERNGELGTERLVVDSAVAAALASANQNNNNSMLLLKDIQDSSSAIIAANAASQIAMLQGQGDIKQAISDSVVSNFQQSAIVTASVTAGQAAILADMSSIKADVAHAAAAAALATAQAKYDTLLALKLTENVIQNDIRDLKDSLPNAREVDLQRQLAVALDDDRFNRLRGHVDSGNVTVTTNVNQAQAQAQTQAQIVELSRQLSCMNNNQQAMATAITVGNGNRGGNQTPTNISQ